MAEDDIFSSTGGGSLLNDLLSDLNAVLTANELTNDDDPTDDLFASLQQDLTSGAGAASHSAKAPPGLMNAGAFVVSRQSVDVDTAATDTTDVTSGEDAWSAALSQFGGMSLAQEFLAADSAKKQQRSAGGGPSVNTTKTVLEEEVFDEEEYAVDQEAEAEEGGLMALLGASRAKSQKGESKKEDVTVSSRDASKSDGIMSPQASTGTKAPPPSPMFPPSMPPPVGMMPPPHPGMFHGPPPHSGMPPPPPGAMIPPHMMSMGPPPGGMPPPPHMMMGPPPPHMMPPHYGKPPGPPPSGPPRSSGGTNDKQQLFKNRDFPALGATPQQIEETKATEPKEEDEQPQQQPSPPSNVRAHILFNNPDPAAPPINATLVESTLMPSRDICFIVNAMMRPLATLDAYNDDYYHWSYVDRKSRNMLLLGGGNNRLLLNPDTSVVPVPNPVWKEVKVQAKEREMKFRESMDARSKEFAEEKKSLGRLVKSNVNRPKALLVTPAMKKVEEDSMEEEKVTESDYDMEQKRQRIQTWRARVAIDKGYTAFLTLTELRRLIQANAGATHLIQQLTGDVKSNVNLLHASFGAQIKTSPDGTQRKIVVDSSRLESTLSMSKGRTLLARVVEGGILPHAGACELLPLVMKGIFETTLPAPDGEERLLRALTSLVLTVQPGVEPNILVKCLEVAMEVGSKDVAKDGTKMPNITGSRVRMELLHAILARGKTVCGGDGSFGWDEKEKQFMRLLTT